jgi:Putative zinc-finger
MNERELIRIIGAGPTKTPRRRWNCPSDTRVAAYVDQRLDPTERSRLEAHLADCDFCLSAVSLMVRQKRDPEPAVVPMPLLEQAIKAVPARMGWSVSTKWLLAPALASIVIISAVLLRSPQQERLTAAVQSSPADTVQPTPDVAQPSAPPVEKQHVRKLATSTPKVLLLEPRPGSVVRRQALRFRWKPAPNAAYYEIRVLDVEGALVWHEQESAPRAQLPAELAIPPGKYFVLVNAYLNNGRSVKSDAMEFQIGSSS